LWVSSRFIVTFCQDIPELEVATGLGGYRTIAVGGNKQTIMAFAMFWRQEDA